MRVLLVSPKGHISGGISRWTIHILNYYKNLENKPCELDFLDIARSRYTKDNIGCLPRLWLAFKDYPTVYNHLKNKLHEKNYDVMHFTSSASWGLIRDLLFIHEARKNKVKTIVHFRFGRTCEIAKKQNWEWKLLCKVVKHADEAIFIDNASYKTMKKNYDNVTLLPNPISPKVLETINYAGNIKRKERVLLFVGHCIATKGVIELVEACKKIKNIHVRLVGTILQSMRKELEKRAGGDWLEIVGEVPYEDVIREMLSCQVFVLPTYTEGFPNVILEAMACGCPIVTTDVGAIPEILEEEDGKQYGIMVKPRNTDQLREAILTMLQNKNLREECETNVRQRVNERYAMPKVWGQIVSIWGKR